MESKLDGERNKDREKIEESRLRDYNETENSHSGYGWRWYV